MFHIFVDLEMNQVSKEGRLKSGPIKNEIIQIGAVKLDEHFRVLDTYEAFVRPVYSEICDICRRLTGITQRDVVGAPRLVQAIDLFLSWVGNTDDVHFYSWSDNDSRQLVNEAAHKGLTAEKIAVFSHWMDFQIAYGKLVEQGRMGLDIALKGAGLAHVGSKHSACSDAISSAQLLKLVKSPKLFNEENRKRIIENTRLVRDKLSEKRKAAKEARIKAAKAIEKMKESAECPA